MPHKSFLISNILSWVPLSSASHRADTHAELAIERATNMRLTGLISREEILLRSRIIYRGIVVVINSPGRLATTAEINGSPTTTGTGAE